MVPREKSQGIVPFNLGVGCLEILRPKCVYVPLSGSRGQQLLGQRAASEK